MPLRPNVALILVGLQNDLLADTGAMRGLVHDDAGARQTLTNGLRLIDAFLAARLLVVNSQFAVEVDPSETVVADGMLGAIRQAGAFRAGSEGIDMIPPLKPYGERFRRLAVRESFNAFAGTQLNTLLAYADVEEIVLVGGIASLCVDSTARSAHERGYRVTVAADAVFARSGPEREFYTKSIFPMYASIRTCSDIASALKE